MPSRLHETVLLVEVQLSRDDSKSYVWPAYVANLRARLRCPVLRLVICMDESVAKWAQQPINLGGDSRIVPQVVGPWDVPWVTDLGEARQNPELAVWSVMCHGQDPEVDRAVRAALVARAGVSAAGLDPDTSGFHVDVIHSALSEAAPQAVQEMKPAGYEYQSDFARLYFGQGKDAGIAEGRAEGHAKGQLEMLLTLLAQRFGAVADTVRVRLAAVDPKQLNLVAGRVLTASSLEDVLGGPL